MAANKPALTGSKSDKAKNATTPRWPSGTEGALAAAAAVVRRCRTSRRSGAAASQSGTNARLTVMLVRVRLTASDFATGGTNHSRVRTKMKPGMTNTTAISNASTVAGMARTAPVAYFCGGGGGGGLGLRGGSGGRIVRSVSSLSLLMTASADLVSPASPSLNSTAATSRHCH